jgi:hypothetical protein
MDAFEFDFLLFFSIWFQIRIQRNYMKYMTLFVSVKKRVFNATI